jgi:spermidine synthase
MPVNQTIRYALLSVLLLCLLPTAATAKVLHQEKSLYQDILITEQKGQRCLAFASKRARGNRVQSCEYSNQKDERLALAYVRMSFAGLLLNSKPQRVLIIGLGGGTVPKVMHQLYPQAVIDTIEIDQAVVNVAREYFAFAANEKMSVNITDARVFVKKATLRKTQYDYILLDAFNGDYIPEHLMTMEFLQELKKLLSQQGVLVANTFSTSQLYDHESTTYQQVFGRFLQLKLPKLSGNRIILAAKQPLPDRGSLLGQAESLAAQMQPYAVPILLYADLLNDKPDWDTTARILTDQYSPANLLR